jgi:hypothetical protein
LGTVGEALRGAIRNPPRARGASKALVAPYIEPTEDKNPEWLKIQVPESKPQAKVVRATIEIEGELAREEDVTEDAHLVELAHVAYHGREWPIGCLLALVNVPTILQDGMKVRIRKKLSPTKVNKHLRGRPPWGSFNDV